MITTTNAYLQEAVHLLNSSGFTDLEKVKSGQELAGETAVVHPLHVGQMLVSYLIGERDTYRDIEHETLVTFKQNLKTAFNNNDLKTVCFELNIPYEDLGAETHDGRIQELIEYGQRHGRLADLVTYCRRERTHIVWPQFPIVNTLAIKPKSNLAIVISINQRALELAADHLAEIQKDCNFVLLTTTPDYSRIQWLPHDRDWQPAVQDFYQTMQHGTLRIPRIRRHFFFATPLPYAFAIGCAWGLVYQGDQLYHWAGSSYVRVLTSTRDWKNK